MGDRPVECSHCKKPVKVFYTEIEDQTITRTEMCADCPVLQQRLYGQMLPPKSAEEAKTDLCCANCRTTLETVKTGNPLGCSECYSVFADVLVAQLIDSDSIPARVKKSLAVKRNQTIHVGKSPEKIVTIASATRLIALNEALNEALKVENYEQAAWLRDQIKTLTDSPNDRKA